MELLKDLDLGANHISLEMQLTSLGHRFSANEIKIYENLLKSINDLEVCGIMTGYQAVPLKKKLLLKISTHVYYKNEFHKIKPKK